MSVSPVPGASSEDPLEDALAKCIERFASEGWAALDSACRRHPESAQQLRTRVGRLVAAGLLAAPPASFITPRRLGDFELLQPLGGGGMGMVFLARQLSLSREVALKLIRPEQQFLPGARERFLRETRIVASLQHPGIVAIHAVDESDGVPFFTMERIRGCSLAEALEDLRTSHPARLRGVDLGHSVLRRAGETRAEVPATFSGDYALVCARIVRAIAEALDHAHARRVLHRDVKPSNVLLTADGRALLTDFGLAAMEGAHQLTRAGDQVGSLAYMSPERVRGAPGADLDPRGDVYALGVMLYEMLALRSPFAASGTAEEVRQRILSAQPEPLRVLNRSIPRDLETVCRVAMAPEPSRRYVSASAFARDLTHFLEGRPVEASAPGWATRLARRARRHPVLTVALTALGAVLLIHQVDRRLDLRRLRAARLTADSAAVAETDPALALLLAYEGARLRADFSAASALQSSLASNHLVREFPHAGRGAFHSARADVDPHEERLAVGSTSGILELLDLRHGGLLARTSCAGPILRVTFSASGELVHAFTQGPSERWTWNPGETEPRQRLPLPGDAACVWEHGAAAILQRMASDGAAVDARIWREGAASVALEGVQFPFSAASVSPDGARVALAGEGFTERSNARRDWVRIHDAATGRLLRELGPHDAPTWHAEFHPRDDRLAVSLESGAVAIWDLAVGRLLETLTAHDAGVFLARHDPSGDRLLTASQEDRSLRLLRLSDGEQRARIPNAALDLDEARWLPSGKSLLTTSRSGLVALWLARPSTWVADLEPVGLDHRVGRMSPGGERVALSTSNSILDEGQGLVLWDAGRGRPLAVLAAADFTVEGPRFTADGTRLGAIQRDVSGTRKAVWWRAQDGQILAQSSALPASPYATVVGPNGAEITCLMPDGELLIWGGEPEGAWGPAEAATVPPAAFSPHDEVALALDPLSGALFVCKGGRQPGAAWLEGANPASGSRLRLELPPVALRRILTSPGGGQVLVCGQPPMLVHWSEEPRVQVLDLHRAPVLDGAFSQDGRWLATASADGTAILWDLSRGRAAWRAPAGAGWCLSAAFTAAGSLRTVANDGRIQDWPLDPVAAAATRLPRAWTVQEAERYGLRRGSSPD